MKNIHILLSIAVLVLSACQVQVDKTFDASSLTHELDSITEIILSENRNSQLANIDYTPNDKDVDRCIEICDTLIAHEIGPNPIIIKLRTLSIAKRYKEFIEFGNSEICSSHEIYPVPGVFECKLNAMQSHLNGDKDGEKKHIELALEKINQYIKDNKSTFESLLKMNREEFDSIVIINAKSNQHYAKALMTIMMYPTYYTYANGVDAWNKEFDRLRKKYPNAKIWDSISGSKPSQNIMEF